MPEVLVYILERVRVALTRPLPKQPLVDRVMEGRASLLISLMTTYHIVAPVAKSLLADAPPGMHRRPTDRLHQESVVDRPRSALELELLASALASKGALWPALVFLDMETACRRSLSDRCVLFGFCRRASRAVAMICDSFAGASMVSLIHGEVYLGFTLLAGVRQGCPVSALELHALVVELATARVLRFGRHVRIHR